MLTSLELELASASDTGAGAGNQGGSPSGGRNALKRGAKSSMKIPANLRLYITLYFVGDSGISRG